MTIFAFYNARALSGFQFNVVWLKSGLLFTMADDRWPLAEGVTCAEVNDADRAESHD
jgi:hypothetical protein